MKHHRGFLLLQVLTQCICRHPFVFWVHTIICLVVSRQATLLRNGPILISWGTSTDGQWFHCKYDYFRVNLLLVHGVIAIFLVVFKIFIWILIPRWCLHVRLAISRFIICWDINRGGIVIYNLNISLRLQRHYLGEGWWHVSRLPFFNYCVFYFIFPFICLFLLVLCGHCSWLSCVDWLIHKLVRWELC